MSDLLTRPPFAERDDGLFLEEMRALTDHHLAGCEAYRRAVGQVDPANRVEDLPFLHVGMFKHLALATGGTGGARERTLHSSATSGLSSRIQLDSKSTELQTRSSAKILSDFLGDQPRPLLVLDSARSLLQRGAVSARVAAAMSLKFLATEIVFLLDDPDDPRSFRWPELVRVLEDHDEVLVYGFSWILWLAWGSVEFPGPARQALAGKTVHFVHSGGWKRLEAEKVDRSRFDARLLEGLSPASKVVDYYGLVEQIGIVYPLCEAGSRHAPTWADVIVRDSHTLAPLAEGPGQLQLLNTLAWGAPYHSVLTEDLGLLQAGPCPCGRPGRRFELLGRLAKAEVRGCANV